MARKLRKEFVFIILILGLFGLGILSTSVFADKEVVFPDENLERAIRKVLNYSDKPLYRSQLLDIVTLDLSVNEIKNIEGLQHFRNLRELNLRYNNLLEVSPLRSLSNLRVLDLGYNHITNLENANFESLKNIRLETLNLDHNVIFDGNQVKVRLSDIHLLSNFTDLHELSLMDNHIKDLKPLAALNKLSVLNLRENKIKTLEGLEKLQNLKKLNLRENQIKDITIIGNLRNLTNLNLHSNQNIRDLSPIAGLNELDTLILRNISMGDQMEVLGGLTSLKRLNLRNCSVSDFSVVFDLMKAGALQDNLGQGVFAYLNIMENPIPNDPYHLRGFRPYWDNIGSKFPQVLNDGILSPPEFSVQSGFYQETLLLKLSSDEDSANIYYTLDGSNPTVNSTKYSTPILINAGEIDQNGMMKGTIVRARIIQNEGYDASPVISHTYFVNSNSRETLTLPIVSLVIAPDHLFDPEVGIYVNFRQRGKKWERSIEMTMFDENGEVSFTQNALVRINGSVTRALQQKSLRFYADNTYEPNEYFNYEFFPGYVARGTGETMDAYSTIIFRNSGNDNSYSLFKDAMIQSLVAHTGLDIQAYRPVNVFINGAYWGILNIRERLDEHYLNNHYNLDNDEITIYDIDIRKDFFSQPIEENEYLQLLEFVRNNQMKDDDNYDKVLSLIDVNNYIDNQIVYIYAANGDWIENNVRLWKANIKDNTKNMLPGHDGLWRWMVVDMDMAFLNADFNLLRAAARDSHETTLLHGLLQNNQFREKFINRFADHLNTSFEQNRVVDEITRFENNLKPDMPFHIERWKRMKNSFERWQENVNALKTFAVHRPNFVRQHIMEEFDIDGLYRLTVGVDPVEGFLRVNTVDILSTTPGIFDVSLWSGIYFNDIPITIEAIPHDGFQFSHWEDVNGGVISSDIRLGLSPNSDVHLKAIFKSDVILK